MNSEILRATVLRLAVPLASVAGILGTWQIATATFGLISPLTLPSPEQVMHTAIRLSTTTYAGTTLASNVWASLQVVIAGWLLGVAIGVPLGVLMGWSARTRDYITPVIEILRPIPPPAWIPFAVLWFGIAPQGRIFVIAMAAVMPCIVNAYGAVRGHDGTLVEAARCLGAGERQIVMGVVLPTSMPNILAGIRIALGNAWMTVVAAELVASSAGLGFMLIQAQYAIQPSVVLVCMTLIGLIGILLSIALAAIERWLCAWR